MADRLGLSSTSILYRWKKECLDAAGPVANELDSRVRELELELRRVERERDVLKKRWLFSTARNSGRLRCG